MTWNTEQTNFIDGKTVITANYMNTLQGKVSERVSVKDFGASPLASASVNTAAIQAGINEVSSLGGGALFFPSGTYLVADSGSDIGGRSYGLLLKSNVALVGENGRTTVIKSAPGADMDLITNDRSTPHTNISLRNITLDGNADGTNTDLLGFNLWLSQVTNLELENVISQYPEAWGLRIQASSFVQLSDITCLHGTATNADGIHFVDCNNVTGDNFNIYTEGDDGFVIEAINSDISDYSITGVKVTSTSSRGILVFSDPDIVPAARNISNVNISGAVVKSCGGSGVVLQGASFSNIKMDAVIEDCQDGLYVVPGTVSYTGTLKNSQFDVLVKDVDNYGVAILTNYATYKNNVLNANVYNPGNNYPGIQVGGDYWTGNLVVDYNPNVDKTLFSAGVLIAGDFNSLKVTSFDAGNNLQFSSSAQDNSIEIGRLAGGVTSDLYFSSGATRNRLSGGTIAGAIAFNGTTGNLFNNVGGATFYGKKSLNFATLGTGDVVVAHGLTGTPAFINLTLQTSALAGHIQPYVVDATNITFRGWNAGGTLVTAGTYTINLDIRL